MSKTSRKKTKSIVISVLLLVVIAVSGFFIYSFHRKQQLAAEVLPNPKDIWYYYGAAGCMSLMDNNNIKIDASYKESIKSECKELLENYSLDNISLPRLSKLIYMDNYFDLGHKDDLVSKLDEYYDTDYKLFDNYKIGSVGYDDFSDEDIFTSELEATLDLYITFHSANINIPDYNVKKLLSDAFNENWEKFSLSEYMKEEEMTLSSTLSSIFITLLSMNEMDLIDYKTAWETLKENYHFYTAENHELSSDKLSSENVGTIDTELQVIKIMKLDVEPEYETVQEYYNLLNSDEAFGYAKNGEAFPLHIFETLYTINDIDLSQNEYFSNNINRWLKENYEAYQYEKKQSNNGEK